MQPSEATAPRRFTTLEDALGAVDDHGVDTWLQAFVRGGGGNAELADGLRRQARAYLGPVLFPLARLRRCCGPEPRMEYPESERTWRERCSSITTAIEGGWEPPPLVVDGSTLVVMDGNHRLAGLTIICRRAHPAIFVFDTAAARTGFVNDEGRLAAPFGR